MLSAEHVIQARLTIDFDCDDPEAVDRLIADLADAGWSIVRTEPEVS